MDLGTELKKAREDADLTQEEVSAAAGIDRAYLSLLENDHKSPTVDMLVRICKVLGLPASELLARAERRQRRKSS